MQQASGATYPDLGAAAKDLTLTGSGYTQGVATGLAGAPGAFDANGTAAYLLRASALTQVATDQFSFVGIFYDNANPCDYTCPWFCASDAGGHVDPFYTFGLFKNPSSQYRVVVATAGFSPVETGVGIISTGSWHQFALVYNGATIKLYVDGVEVFSTARTGNVSDMGSFAFGDIPALGAGFVPNIRVAAGAYWADHALTSTEVTDLYDAMNEAPCDPPTNDGGSDLPQISGTTEVGETLTCDEGVWSFVDSLTTYTFQWYRVCGTLTELLVGETSSSYTITEDDEGCNLFCEVTADNGCLPNGVADAAEVGPVTIPPAPPVNTVAPVVSGVPLPGHALETTTGTWTGSPTPTFTYQWEINCDGGTVWDELVGETGTTLELTELMIGCEVRCVVTGTNTEGSSSADSNAIEVQANVPAAVEICEGPLWRFVVTDLDCAPITWLERLARNRTVTYVLNGASVATGTVPSDDPRINIPHTDGDPYLAEGNRLLFGFRYEPQAPGISAWIVRFAGIIMQLEDGADADNSDTPYTAYDPWQYLRSRPVRNGPDFSYTLPGVDGSSYTDTRIDVIVGQILRNTIVTDGPVFIDAGTAYGGTAYWGGVIEACDQIDINFQQGSTVGDAWDELVSSNQADIVLTPIYDPDRRPGYTHELSIFQQAGAIIDDAIFSWDKVPRNAIGVSRLLEGSARANSVKFWSGQGGTAPGGQTIPVQTDATSEAKYGSYWGMQFFPGNNVPAAVEALAAAQLSIRKNGRQTVTISPSPDCATALFQQFNLGDRVPVYASDRMRAELSGYQRIYGIPISIADDATETIERMLASKEGVA